MDRTTAVVLTAVAGGLIALQAPINSHLGKAAGTFQGALLSFLIGTAALVVVAALAKAASARSPTPAACPGTGSSAACWARSTSARSS